MSTESGTTTQDKKEATEAGSITNNKLRVVLSDKAPKPLIRSVVTLQGLCPPDFPYWNNQTLSRYDRRDLPPYTLRFSASSDGEGIHVGARQDEFRQGIWQAIGHEMNNRGLKGALPTILVEKDPLDSSKACGCIDVTFHDDCTFLALMNTIYDIQLEKAGGAPWILHRTVVANSLPADTIPFDLLRLSVTPDNGKAILQSLTTMVKALGSVIGIGKREFTDKVCERSHGPSSVVRGYLKLAPSSMTMPFKQLCLSIPTHFKWKGRLYTLQFAGRDYHKKPLHSADYPLEEVAEESDDPDTRLSNPSRSSTVSDGQSSTLA